MGGRGRNEDNRENIPHFSYYNSNLLLKTPTKKKKNKVKSLYLLVEDVHLLFLFSLIKPIIFCLENLKILSRYKKR